jgi:hypothetical protein
MILIYYIHVVLILPPGCAPEKVDVNQKGVNKNYIPIRKRG